MLHYTTIGYVVSILQTVNLHSKFDFSTTNFNVFLILK